MNAIIDTHQEIDSTNLQEILDASSSAGRALFTGQAQYQTPEWFARTAARLFFGKPHQILDPQCAEGHLLDTSNCYEQYGIEIDNRISNRQGSSINRITGNCVEVIETLDEVYPDTKFSCIAANPPFGILLKTKDGNKDSTLWTWELIKSHLMERGRAYLIGNASTIERLGLHEQPGVYLYQRFPVGVFETANVEVGLIHFHQGEAKPRKEVRWDHVPSENEMFYRCSDLLGGDYWHSPYESISKKWTNVNAIIEEERKKNRSPWNVWLNDEGLLRTYLSTRKAINLDNDEIKKLAGLNNCHPLTLTTEKETRLILHSVVTSGLYSIEPAAHEAIVAALKEVHTLACPIMPVTDFELVAYADENETLKVRDDCPPEIVRDFHLTPGKKYDVGTGSYQFQENFTRKSLYTDPDSGKSYLEDHEWVRTGSDRFIRFVDDYGRAHKFMDKPGSNDFEHDEGMIWQIFEKPDVPTIKETNAEQYAKNLEVMQLNAMLAGFTYYEGQIDYCARVGCKDHGLIAAETGTGKSVMALTMIALKNPGRSLIIAPQGTMRSVGEEGDEDYQASQWVQEIQRFAPTEPVFQLFSESDYRHILHANGGELPRGVYVTYPSAFFSNNAFENLPKTWELIDQEEKFCKLVDLPYDEKKPEPFYSDKIGHEKNGVRCVAKASLSTIIASAHGEWDMVLLDEAHLIQNLDSNITSNVIRLQPKYRFAMTATPIPNIVTNLFSLMGWLCVPDWYKGKMRNAAWPYSCEEEHKFSSTFLSMELDKTAKRRAKVLGKKGGGFVKVSPIISSPARLLKLLKPNIAYVSKLQCNPNLKPCEIIDVRVPIGSEQAKLYAYWMHRPHYLPEFKNPMKIAMVQSTRLRGVCASPASLDYTRGMCKSNYNPKTVAALKIIKECLEKGEQVTVVSARVEQSNEMARRLRDAGVQISRIDSSTPPSLHTAEANRFKRGDSRVMLMGIKCAQAHSFENCPNEVILSLEWNYGSLNQAQGRVWRLNSPKTVKVWVVLHSNTIEELMFDRVGLKQDSATLCLLGKRAPRNFKTVDASEILAEHVANYDQASGEVASESDCEAQWPTLMKQIMLANMGGRIAKAA